MSTYFEMQNVLFRGELAGANGVARFRLTADAIDAVDTVNIQGQSVTFEKIAAFSNSIGAGGEIVRITTVIPDAGHTIECLYISSNPSLGWSMQWNGSPITVYNPGNGQRRNDTSTGKGSWLGKWSPAVAMRRDQGAGTHTLRVVNTSGGTLSQSGYLIMRYLRETGS